MNKIENALIAKRILNCLYAFKHFNLDKLETFLTFNRAANIKKQKSTKRVLVIKKFK